MNKSLLWLSIILIALGIALGFRTGSQTPVTDGDTKATEPKNDPDTESEEVELGQTPAPTELDAAKEIEGITEDGRQAFDRAANDLQKSAPGPRRMPTIRLELERAERGRTQGRMADRMREDPLTHGNSPPGGQPGSTDFKGAREQMMENPSAVIGPDNRQAEAGNPGPFFGAPQGFTDATPEPLPLQQNDIDAPPPFEQEDEYLPPEFLDEP